MHGSRHHSVFLAMIVQLSGSSLELQQGILGSVLHYVADSRQWL